MLVTFCGHKDVTDTAQVKEKLESVIAELIVGGATEFYLGGYGQFDSMAAHIVRDIKKIHPEVQISTSAKELCKFLLNGFLRSE